MLSLSSLIDFLLSLLRDEDAQAEFERDPQGMLARHNLDGVTAQDIRDVQPMLADCDGVSYRGGNDRGGNDRDGSGHSGGGHSGGGGRDRGDHDAGGSLRPHQHDDDPVRVIHHVQNTHHVEREVVVRHENHHTTQQIEYKQYNTEFTYTDNSVYVADGGTYIQDSYNQDNDGVDLKGAEIVDSNVVVGDENTVGNTVVTTEETTTVTESFNEDSSEDVVIVDSGNVGPAPVQQPAVESINGSYDPQPSSATSAEPDAIADPSAA